MAKRYPEPGMDDAQAAADRRGFRTTMEMVTGAGNVVATNDMGGPEVGNQYDADPMGEDYSAITYPSSEPDWGGGAKSAPSAVMERSTTAGNKVASAPQNRTTFGGKD